MTMTRLMGAAAVAALIAGAAHAQTPAQTPAAPAAQPAPATTAPAPTPTPAPATAATPPAANPTAVGQLAAKGDIVDTLRGNPQFSTLVKGLDATNLTEVLKKNSGLTVFAPTNAAFAALPAGELDKLMKDPAALQKVLTYHVINATVDSTKIKGAKGGVKTVAGTELVIDGSGETLMANNATIVQADVKATNGTVHVVDKVLMPGAAVAATTGTTSDAAATAPAQPAPPATEPAEPAATPPATTTPDPTTDSAEPADETPATPPK